MRELEYRNGNRTLKIIPSSLGLATVFDKDILIFCISQLMHKKNRGEPIGRRVRFNARELLITTNRKTGGIEYKRLKAAFLRLMGTTFQTDITTGDRRETRFFSMIESGSGFVMKGEGKWRLDYCEVILSEWLFRAIESNEVATISKEYFQLRRPLERRLYEIARKHCGNQSRWHISLAKLKLKAGSSSPLSKFRYNIRQIASNDHIPFYSLMIDETDLVVFRPRKQGHQAGRSITLPDWAEEKARAIASDKGWDYHVLRSDWMSFAQRRTAEGNPPKNPGAAFVAYCKKQRSLR